MSKTYLLAHDLGTSGNKATLFDTEGHLVNSITCSYPLSVTNGCYAEQNAGDWWDAVCRGTRYLCDAVDPADIAAVSFSGQMMGCLCVDRDGQPLRPSLIWADMRGTDPVKRVAETVDAYDYYRLCGHRLSPSYSAAKLAWIRDNEPDVYRKTQFTLNAKDYILFRLTGQMVTEPSDASSTCLYDITRGTWSKTLCGLYGLAYEKLPELRRSIDPAGTVTREAAAATGLLEGTPVICGGGDGACAAVGSGVVREGVANCCLGTSSWISCAAKKPLLDPDMTNFNFAHMVPGYVLPTGTMQQGGGSLSYIVKTLFADAYEAGRHPDDIYAAVGREAAAAPLGTRGLLWLPYLIGERSPRWNDKARGCFVGLTLEHKRGDLLRAVMEGVAMNLDIILRTFEKTGAAIDRLLITGGGARNAVWRQILADVFGLPIDTPAVLEGATSMGAAVAAGIGCGAFDGFDAVDRFIRVAATEQPDQTNHLAYEPYKASFERCYQALEPFFDTL